ncbi:MAG: hypothetical protein HUJ63_01895, partial [Enterococcus sp.]|nr:hypothetical protein [Enterococcus sp.]
MPDRIKKSYIGQRYFINKMLGSTLVVMTISFFMSSVSVAINGALIGSLLGTAQLAAYGIATPIFTLFTAIAGLFSAGTQNLCAKYMSRGHLDRANQIFSISVLVFLALTIVTFALMYSNLDTVAQILGAKRDNPEVFTYTVDYLSGIILVFPGIFGCQVFVALVQLDGNKKAVFVSFASIFIVNIGLSLFNVLVLQWGIFGVSFAISLGYITGAIMHFVHFLSPKSSFKIGIKGLKLKDLGSIFLIGTPKAVNTLCQMFRNI